MRDRHTSERRRRTRRTAAAVVVAALTVGGVSAVGVSSAQATGLVSYASAVPGWAKKANATSSTSSSARIEAEMFLDLQDQQGAEDLAAAVSDPTSASYRQYLSPADWIAKYAPTTATYSSKLAFLKSQGFTITGQPASRQYIVFSGTAKQMNAAFSTKLDTYAVDGQKLVAPSTTPTLPADVADGVSAISLDQGRMLTRPQSATRATTSTTGLVDLSTKVATTTAKATAKAYSAPCSSYSAQHKVSLGKAYGSTAFGTANCGYTPKQLRALYKQSSTAGQGQTVAIVGVYNSPSIQRDTNTYSSLRGEAGFTTGQYTDVSAPRSSFTSLTQCGKLSGWQVEQSLDVQAVHAVAPKAKIVYSGASDCGPGTDIALSKVLDQGLATLVSNSYGGVGEYQQVSGGAAYMDGEINLQLQAAGEGIGLYFASGDDGDETVNLGYKSVDFPASSPWVTAVGGTTVGLTKSNTKAYRTGWGDKINQVLTSKSGRAVYRTSLPGTFVGGAGGGASYRFAQPSYQSNVSTSSKRTVPDVAALADPYTGFLIGYHPITSSTTFATGSWKQTVAGGTSLATPIFTALMATVQQKTGAQVGFANPILYSLRDTSPSTFIDVVSQKTPHAVGYTTGGHRYLVTFGQDSSLKVTAGYDRVTGLGELNMNYVSGFKTPTPAAPSASPTATALPTATASPTP